MKTASAAAILVLSISGFPLFAEPDLTKLPPPSAKQGLTYAKDVRPIFQSTCFRCHGEERQKGHLRLDSLEAALKGSEDGQVILPGKSEKSPLVIAVARLDPEKAMPPMKGPGRGGPGGPGGQRTARPGAPGQQPPGIAGGPGPGVNRPPGQGGPGGGMGPMAKPLTAE